jgi:hypothetical protein
MDKKLAVLTQCVYTKLRTDKTRINKVEKNVRNIKDRLYRRGVKGTSTESILEVIKTITTELRDLTADEKTEVVNIIMQVNHPVDSVESLKF